MPFCSPKSQSIMTRSPGFADAVPDGWCGLPAACMFCPLVEDAAVFGVFAFAMQEIGCRSFK